MSNFSKPFFCTTQSQTMGKEYSTAKKLSNFLRCE
jgi:hypothetical protein